MWSRPHSYSTQHPAHAGRYISCCCYARKRLALLGSCDCSGRVTRKSPSLFAASLRSPPRRPQLACFTFKLLTPLASARFFLRSLCVKSGRYLSTGKVGGCQGHESRLRGYRHPRSAVYAIPQLRTPLRVSSRFACVYTRLRGCLVSSLDRANLGSQGWCVRVILKIKGRREAGHYLNSVCQHVGDCCVLSAWHPRAK